jgi:hypothetical protein
MIEVSTGNVRAAETSIVTISLSAMVSETNELLLILGCDAEFIKNYLEIKSDMKHFIKNIKKEYSVDLG